MQIHSREIKVEKTARFYCSNENIREIKSVWIVIHGYAQLAKDFINDFEFLSNENTLIIAPEGLSKFYFRNKIGASWMTKEDRSNEINDYLFYLDKIMNEISEKFDLTRSKINLLGFSQGVHTAVRFFIHSQRHFDNLILCSSDFPKDADFVTLKTKLVDSQMYFIHGSKDEVIGEKVFNESKSLLESNEVIFVETVFEGGHVINQNSLTDFLIP